MDGTQLLAVTSCQPSKRSVELAYHTFKIPWSWLAHLCFCKDTTLILCQWLHIFARPIGVARSDGHVKRSPHANM